jgi:multidrug resistance efflux pump
MEITVFSPKAAFVASVTVADRAHVQRGDVILNLSSVEEDIQIARLTALENLRLAHEARLSDAVLNLNRQIAQTAIDMATQLSTAAANRLTQQENGIVLGRPNVDSVELASLITDDIQLPFQGTQAKLQKQQLELRITEAKAINDLIKRHLIVELEAAQASKSATRVTALADGQVKLAVAPGAFVRKGDGLFTIA